MDRRVTRSMRKEEVRLKAEEEMKEVSEVGYIIMGRARSLREAKRIAKYPKKQKLTSGYRSMKDEIKALTWRCPACKKVNHPERHLLVCLPVTRCECGHEPNIDFDFSMHKLDLNNHFLIPNIRLQNEKECSPCSMLSLAEICWRVNAIISGQILEDNAPNLSKTDLLEKYDYLCRACGIEKRFNQTAVETMFEIFSTIGVESKEKEPQLYVLPYYTAVKKNFRAISQLLADGYAVRTSLYVGKNFSRLKPGQIYKSPGRGRSRHAIVLIGAGRRRGTEYYHFVNSWGKVFCFRQRKRFKLRKLQVQLLNGVHKRQKARGGFGILRASDIVARPVTFLRHETDFEYYKHLLHQDIVPWGRTRDMPEEVSIGASIPSKSLELTEASQKNADQNDSLNVARIEQQKADEQVLQLLENHKKEKKDAVNKIPQLERQVDEKQKLELDIGQLKGKMVVLKHMEGDHVDVKKCSEELTAELDEKIEEMEGREAPNQALIVKERMTNDEIQDAKKELITALTDLLLGLSSNIAIKRMSELVEDVEMKATELVSLRREHLKDPNWHPTKIVTTGSTTEDCHAIPTMKCSCERFSDDFLVSTSYLPLV